MKWTSILLLFLSACGGNSDGPKTQAGEIAFLTISDTPLFDFGIQPVESVTDKTFTVSNLGSKPATEINGGFYLSLAFSYKDGAFPGTGGTCESMLEALEMCTIVVSFSPKYTGIAETPLILEYFNGTQSTSVNGPTLHGQGG